MIENGIKGQTNSIPVHPRVILKNGESFMEGVDLIKNYLNRLMPILAKETPEGLCQIYWKIIVKGWVQETHFGQEGRIAERISASGKAPRQG